MKQVYTQFAIQMLWDGSTGRDEIGDYFATEAGTMIDIVGEVDLNKDWF